MRDALNATGRPIFLAIRGKSKEFDRLSYDIWWNMYLEWGSDNPFFWEVNVANSWRTTQGSTVNWERILYNIDIV